MVRTRRPSLTTISLGDGGQFRLGARPVPVDRAGWCEPESTFNQETVAVQNEGIDTFGGSRTFYAGIVDYSPGETVVWTAVWETPNGSTMPTWTPGSGDGSVSVYHPAGGEPYSFALTGKLTLSATVNGLDAGSIYVLTGSGEYSSAAWWPEP